MSNKSDERHSRWCFALPPRPDYDLSLYTLRAANLNVPRIGEIGMQRAHTRGTKNTKPRRIQEWVKRHRVMARLRAVPRWGAPGVADRLKKYISRGTKIKECRIQHDTLFFYSSDANSSTGAHTDRTRRSSIAPDDLQCLLNMSLYISDHNRKSNRSRKNKKKTSQVPHQSAGWNNNQSIAGSNPLAGGVVDKFLFIFFFLYGQCVYLFLCQAFYRLYISFSLSL